MGVPVRRCPCDPIPRRSQCGNNKPWSLSSTSYRWTSLPVASLASRQPCILRCKTALCHPSDRCGLVCCSRAPSFPSSRVSQKEDLHSQMEMSNGWE